MTLSIWSIFKSILRVVYIVLSLITIALAIGTGMAALGSPIPLPFNEQYKTLSGVVATLTSTVLSLLAYAASRATPTSPYTDSQIIQKRKRNRVLESVSSYWIEGVLKNSLPHEVPAQLGLKMKPSILKPSPPRLWIQKETDRVLDPALKIIDIFQLVKGSLLILGEPGSGKTTMLLELTNELIQRAIADESQPIPVVFNLSSWAAKRQNIAEWLVEELSIHYKVGKELGGKWIATDSILPLLDGLDEVKQEFREECVNAINKFREEHDVDIVVCSRIQEYNALSVELDLKGGIIIQPLTVEQIDEYLGRIGEDATGIRPLLREGTELFELAQTPLMLTIILLVYHANTDNIMQLTGSVEARRASIFDTYVRYMLEVHRNLGYPADAKLKKVPQTKTIYDPQQAKQWLIWLANMMRERNQTIFLLEQLQPNWLTTPHEKRSYENLFRFSILIIGIILLFRFGVIELFTELTWWSILIIVEVIVGILLLPKAVARFAQSPIKVEERWSWSWSKAKEGLESVFAGLILGLLIVAVLGFVLRWFFKWDFLSLDSETIFSLGLMFALGLPFTMLTGLSRNEVTTRTEVNQGIRQLARKSTFTGLAAVLFIAVMGSLIGIIYNPQFLRWDRILSGFRALLPLALMVGFGLTLFLGGATCLRHLAIRFILWHQGYMPWNYTSFLNYAKERLLLRQVGGGYIFIHRLLLDHLADSAK